MRSKYVWPIIIMILIQDNERELGSTKLYFLGNRPLGEEKKSGRAEWP